MSPLLVWSGEPVSLDRLVDVVWPAGTPMPRNPVSSLRTYVTRLRHVLEPGAVGARHAQRHAIRRHAAGLDATQVREEELDPTGQAYAPGTARRHAT